MVRVLEQWDDIQPTPDQFLWSLPGGTDGIDDQLSDITRKLGSRIGNDKFVNLVIRAGGALAGKRMPEGAQEGGQGGALAGEDGDKVVRWDPQYTCRYWKLVKESGKRFDGDARINTV